MYERSLLLALREKGLSAESQVPLKVMFRGAVVGDFFADIVVEGNVIIELKTTRALLPEYQAQVINYLKATGVDIALLVNFGNPKLELRRLHR